MLRSAVLQDVADMQSRYQCMISAVYGETLCCCFGALSLLPELCYASAATAVHKPQPAQAFGK